MLLFPRIVRLTSPWRDDSVVKAGQKRFVSITNKYLESGVDVSSDSEADFTLERQLSGKGRPEKVCICKK